MMRGRLLFVLWCSNILAAARSITVTGNSCVSDYIRNITCTGKITSPMNRSSKYSLRFISDDRTIDVFCPVIDQDYFCNCKVSDSHLATYDMFDIVLYNEYTNQTLQRDFQPRQNIKLNPPPEVELQQSTHSINITCKSEMYETHSYLKSYLTYEVLLQESHSSWNKTLYLSSSQNVVRDYSKSQLKPNTEHCVKARFKTQDTKTYNSTWSEWSEPVCWTNEPKKEQEDIVPLLLKSLGPVCLTIGILLFVFYNPATRMKIKTLGHTPTPAPFFKPLFQQHEGNLQEWLSPHGNYVVTYKTEEDLTADAVTVVPKSSPKDLEGDQVFLTTPATQLVFPLSHTSYVGLPGMDKAFPPIPVVCSGDTPYTQLPCSVWGPGVQEIEIVCSDPKDFLELSHSDSGCSCENLTQSLECSLPCSPVDEIPSSSHCNDYCILNKTAQGLVPVLLSKERAANDLSNSLKSG